MMDREGALLEEQFEELLDRIPHEFVLDLVRNRKWRRTEKAYAEAREAAAELARLKNEEAARRKQLEVEAQDWHRAAMIRKYADHIEASVVWKSEEPVQIWLRCARAVANDVDPSIGRCQLLGEKAPLPHIDSDRRD